MILIRETLTGNFDRVILYHFSYEHNSSDDLEETKNIVLSRQMLKSFLRLNVTKNHKKCFSDCFLLPSWFSVFSSSYLEFSCFKGVDHFRWLLVILARFPTKHGISCNILQVSARNSTKIQPESRITLTRSWHNPNTPGAVCIYLESLHFISAFQSFCRGVFHEFSPCLWQNSEKNYSFRSVWISSQCFL